MAHALDVFLTFLRLGVSSFGGPAAHIGYFRRAFVTERAWLSEAQFAEFVGLAQLLPGPSSSQVGMLVGYTRAGWIGMVLAWLAFTAPSAIALTVFALFSQMQTVTGSWWLHGLLLTAVAIVAQAVLAMWRTLANDLPRSVLAGCAAAIALWFTGAYTQVGIIIVGALVGVALLRNGAQASAIPLGLRGNRRVGIACAAAFVLLLIGLPLARGIVDTPLLAIIDVYYRVGALVFGGGHVVLPLLQAQVLPQWVSPERFVAGYGAAQAVPGPLFTFAAYLGAVADLPIRGVAGAAIATLAIFAPSFLLLGAIVPFWEAVRANARVQAMIRGINASVVGMLFAALVTPIATSAVHQWSDALIAVTGFLLLEWRRWPAWSIVALCLALAAVQATITRT